MLTKRTGQVFLAVVVPAAVATAALLAAEGIASLVDATLTEGSVATSARIAPATPTFASAKPTADAILDRNPFDHTTSLRPRPTLTTFKDFLAEIPPCEGGFRPVVIVATDEPDVSFAAFEVDGKRVLRKRHDEIAGMRVAYIGRDRVYFEKNESGHCQARLFGQHVKNEDAREREGSRIVQQPGTPSPFEKEIAGKIVKRSETEYEIDRATVDRILEAQTELMKARVVPEKEGDKVIGVRILSVKPGSVLSLIGIQSNDRLETINGFSVGTPEEALQAYARLRSGADRLTVHLTRNGRAMNIDYSIR